MSALGITDHGNLYGVPEFYFAAKKAGVKPVIGCEFYLCDSPMTGRKDSVRYHQVLWAANEAGYRNLCRLSSLSFTKGFYYKPRIDLELLSQYSEGLVATTCCLQGQIPQMLLQNDENKARKLLKKYREIFGDNYYIELQNHNIDDQEHVNQTLSRWAEDMDIRVLATNDVHYVNEADH